PRTPAPRGGAPAGRGGAPRDGGGPRATGASSRAGGRPVPASRGGSRPGSGNRPATRGGPGRPRPRGTSTGLRPANPRLLRQRLFVFVVVTLLVALGIAAAQGCQGPSRGLGVEQGGVRVEQQHGQAAETASAPGH
ncbi:serine/threonine protein kinase, partial [Streptomyces sp. NPDC059641]